jgi:serine/threonine protein kinase
MESIRDRHSKTFSTLTDFFSFGIISFQLFLGVHPFKGRHSKYKTLDERMMNNISVFNKDVSIPTICAPFTVIPENYRNWYKAIFEEGKRLPPPTTMQQVVIVQTYVKDMIKSQYFDITKIKEYDVDIIQYYSRNGIHVVVNSKGGYVEDKLDTKIQLHSHFVVTPKQNYLVAANIKEHQLELYNVTSGKEIECDISCDNIMSYDGRLYVKKGINLLEIQFLELPMTIKVASKVVSTVMENATHLFNGVVIQNLLGAWYVSLFPKSGQCYQIRINELNDCRDIMDAKFDNNVLIIGTVNNKMTYDRFIVRFSEKYDSYDVRIEKDVQFDLLNFVVLDNGICVYMNSDESLELFSNKKGQKQVKVIKDPDIPGDITLFKDGVKALFAKGNKLYHFTMKGKK